MGNDSGGGSNGAEESGARGNALQPGFVALEPRILLDAAALAAAADSIDDDAADSAQPDSLTETENGETGDEVVAALAALSAPAERREVVFVDAKVSDYRALAAGLDAGVELVVLSAEGDGVQQVADYLEGRSGIDAIHLVSHGDVGRIELGDTTLEAGNTDAYADALERIDVALAEAGDILLYGCRIGQDGAGQDFIDGLAQLTGADVAASDDLTGSAALGGDWDLEALSGSIETDNPIARESLTGFDHVLATPVAGFGNALTFDGTNDDVQISANADLALAQNDFTLEAWFKTT